MGVLLSSAEIVLDPDANPESHVAFRMDSYGFANERAIAYAAEKAC